MEDIKSNTDNNNLKKISYPSHHPYEDGWGFCFVCQRFYHPLNELKEKYRLILPFNCPGCGGPMKIESTKLNKKSREVNKDGLGLPLWAYLSTFVNTEQGKQSIERFKAQQDKIRAKIESAPYNRVITFGKLGAKQFTKHWFFKKYTGDGDVLGN